MYASIAGRWAQFPLCTLVCNITLIIPAPVPLKVDKRARYELRVNTTCTSNKVARSPQNSLITTVFVRFPMCG